MQLKTFIPDDKQNPFTAEKEEVRIQLMHLLKDLRIGETLGIPYQNYEKEARIIIEVMHCIPDLLDWKFVPEAGFDHPMAYRATIRSDAVYVKRLG